MKFMCFKDTEVLRKLLLDMWSELSVAERKVYEKKEAEDKIR